MGDPTGEADNGPLRLDFDRRLLLQFRGSTVEQAQFDALAGWATIVGDRCLAGARVRQSIGARVGQAQPVIQFAVSQQPGIGGDRKHSGANRPSIWWMASGRRRDNSMA